jgi:hypothetical protein
MNSIKLFSAIILLSPFLFSCGGNAAQQEVAKKADSPQQLFDTAKIKSDMNTMMNTISDAASGKQPDTTKLKAAMADVMTTATKVLSDSGINAMGGDDNDPSVVAAKKTLVKMRNGIGVTPAAIDSMKKAIAQLQAGSQKK